MPVVFVLIWSTGFIVARYGMPHSPPFSFLALRYALSVACFLLWILVSKPAWPTPNSQYWHLAITGILIHATYLGGVWAAVKLGMGAGLSALLVSLQPILTAIWLSSRGQGVSARQVIGLLLGFVGLILVLWGKLGLGEVTPLNLTCILTALLGITAGTLYQKRYVQPCDVRTANLVQLTAAFVITAPMAFMEPEPMRWMLASGQPNGELMGAMAWSVLGSTLGGSSLLYLLIQRGAATSVASLFYLVPPVTAVMAWALFGEEISALTGIGTALAALGVSFVVRQPTSRPGKCKSATL